MDVVATLVLVAVHLDFDRESFVRADALFPRVADLFVEHPCDGPDAVLVQRELPKPHSDRRFPAVGQAGEEFALKRGDFPPQIVGERQALGEPRRDRRAGTRSVGVHLRPAPIAVLEVLPAEDEHVALLQRVEVALVQVPDPLVVRAGEHVAGERVGNRPDVGHVDDAGQPSALSHQRFADGEIGVVVLPVGRVVLVVPHLGVDVSVLHPVVIRGEIPEEGGPRPNPSSSGRGRPAGASPSRLSPGEPRLSPSRTPAGPPRPVRSRGRTRGPRSPPRPSSA